MSDKIKIASSLDAIIAGYSDSSLKLQGQFADMNDRVADKRNQRVERLFLKEGIKAAPPIDHYGCDVTQYLDHAGQEQALKIHRNGKILFEAYPLPEDADGNLLQARVLHPNQELGIDLNRTKVAGETHRRRLPDQTKIDLATANLVEATFNIGVDANGVVESYVFKAAGNGQSGKFIYARDGWAKETISAERDTAGRLRLPVSTFAVDGQERFEQIFASICVSDLGDATLQNHLRSNYESPSPALQSRPQPSMQSRNRPTGPAARSPGLN